jgi:radical SAM superfamily enzyme YgiQ (UPF0313 family)
MKRAGCWQISFGLETGSDEMLQKMDKCAGVAKSEQAVEWTAAAGIRVKGLLMLGYPGETNESIDMTKQFIQRIPMTIMNLTKFTPYPGSPIYRELYGTSIREDHWEKMNGMNFVWAPEGISVEALDRHYMDVISSFYRQKRVRRAYVRTSVRHPIHLRRLIRCGVGFGLAKTKSFLAGRRGLLIQGDETSLDLTTGHQNNAAADGANSSSPDHSHDHTPVVQVSISSRPRKLETSTR